MTRNTMGAAEMRAKFAREALLDLPATATAAEREAAQKLVDETRAAMAHAFFDKRYAA